MSAHPTLILNDIHSGVILSEPLEANAELTSNSGINPRPSNQFDFLERHPRSRFTLYRILLGVIPFVFAVSKFIDHFSGSPLTLNILDLILAILMLILYWCSLYESDPPPHLQWLLDTDWNYVFDVCQRCAVAMKNNPLGTWSVFVLMYSVLFFGGRIVHQAWVCQGNCDVLDAVFFGSFELGFMILNVVLTISGASKHQAHTHIKSSIIAVGLLFQIGSLVISILDFSPTIHSTFRFFRSVAVCFFMTGSLLVFCIGRTVNPSKLVLRCILLCLLSVNICTVISLSPDILIHDRMHVWVSSVLIVINAVGALFVAGVLFSTFLPIFRST